jgi:dephospho-CoA kinase
MRIIAFVGMPASGKGEVAAVAKELGYPVVNMGDVIREEVHRLGLEPTDENLGSTGIRLRQEEGLSAIARRCVTKLRVSEGGVAVVDGVRNIEEVHLFKREFGNDFLLINIESSTEDRLARIRARGRADDRLMDEERLRIRDERELGWGMGESIKNADLTIVNDGTVDQLRKKVRKIIEEQR